MTLAQGGTDTPLLFIRHGETDWNRQQRFQGQIDVPLNSTGQAQAARLGQRLAAGGYDVLLCSDLTRTQQTAAPLAQAWGLQPQLMPGFREQHFGAWEGLDVPAIKAQHAELWPQWLQHDGDFCLPGGGESLRQFHARVMAAVQQAVAQYAGARVAVVTHGGVLDMLWRTAQGLPISGLRTCDIPNTGLNHLRWAGGRLFIDSWGDAGHLAGLPEQPSTAAGER
jgi:probable phosphoglycerate mutase